MSTSQEYRDLGKLARKRCRESAMSVIQLLDEDQEKAALLVSIALDFINGATVMLLDEEGVTEQEALGAVLTMMFDTIGPAKVAKSLQSWRTGKCSSA